MALRALLTTALTAWSLLQFMPAAHALDYEDYPVVKLRTLDKITARTMTFEAKVGSTMKFGEIFIKVQTCRKPPPVQKTEASAFLQIWETDTVKDQSRWIFSGWMFGSSPTLSAMDHPVYDVWVIDCIGKDPEELPPPEAVVVEDDKGVDGVLPNSAAPALPSTEALDQETENPSPAPISGSIPETAAPVETEPVVEETVPTSNMPADAAPVSEEETIPQTEAPVEETPPVTAPVPEQNPAPAGTSDSFQGIY